MDDRQQTHLRKVVPLNPNPQWPKGYDQVLEQLGVEKQRHSFYVHWVRLFFRCYQKNRRRRGLGGAEINAFLKELTDDPRVADWQVTQAREALVIYYEQLGGNRIERSSRLG